MTVTVALAFLLVGIVSVTLALTFFSMDLDTVEYIACGFSAYFMIYILVSSALFLLRSFSIDRCIILSSIISILGFAVTYQMHGRQMSVSSIGYGNIYVVLAVFLGVCFASGSFEFYGMGQDEGVYQTEAINLLYGNAEWSYTIQEHGDVADPDYREYYYRNIVDNLGFDVASEVDRNEYFLFATNDGGDDGIFGFWHGMPSFASILALSSLVFGIENMMLIQLLFYICYGFICGALIKKTGADKADLFILTFLALICPVIIWVSKSALTEVFLAVIVSAFLLFALQGSYSAQMISILPILSFCFYHISAYFVIPVVLLIYWGFYFESGLKQYIYLARFLIVFYFLSFIYIAYLQPIYTGKNVAGAIPYVTKTTQFYFVLAVCLVALILTWRIVKIGHMQIAPVLYTRAITCICGLGIANVFFQAYKTGFDYSKMIMLTLPVFAIITGVFLLPVVMAILFTENYEINRKSLLIGVLFLWMIIVFSVIRGNIAYYYYYARYLAPYAFVIPVAYNHYTISYLEVRQGMFSDRKAITLRLLLRYLFPVVSVFILLPFTSVIKNNTDDSRLEWEVVEDVLEVVKNNVDEEGLPLTVVLDESLVETLFHPMRAVAGKCFITNDQFDIDYLRNNGIRPDIYISSDKSSVDILPDDMLSLAYMKTSVTEEDDLFYRSRILGLPTDIEAKNRFTVFIYRNALTEQISFHKNADRLQEGWHPPNLHGFYWTSEYSAILSACLERRDYLMTLLFGDMIPFDLLSFDEISIKVIVNGEDVHTLKINESNQSNPVVINIDQSIINTGYNEFRVEADHMWSPAEYGAEDTRSFGFSLSEVRFE